MKECTRHHFFPAEIITLKEGYLPRTIQLLKCRNCDYQRHYFVEGDRCPKCHAFMPKKKQAISCNRMGENIGFVCMNCAGQILDSILDEHWQKLK